MNLITLQTAAAMLAEMGYYLVHKENDGDRASKGGLMVNPRTRCLRRVDGTDPLF